MKMCLWHERQLENALVGAQTMKEERNVPRREHIPENGI